MYRGHWGTLPQTAEQWEIGGVIPSLTDPLGLPNNPSEVFADWERCYNQVKGLLIFGLSSPEEAGDAHRKEFTTRTHKGDV